MNCSTPGLLVHHQLPESTQTHVHCVSDAIQPSTISSSVVPFSSCLQSFPTSGSFLISEFFTLGDHIIWASASESVLPMNIQGWFPLGLTGLIFFLSKGLSRVKSINSSVLSFPYSPTLTSIHDYWEKLSFEYMKLCLKINVSAF